MVRFPQLVLVLFVSAAVISIRLTLLSRTPNAENRGSQQGQDRAPRDVTPFWEVPSAAPAPPDLLYIWWEAETPRVSNFPTSNPFAPQNPEQAAVLSQGKWVGADNPGSNLFLEYDVDVASAGTYELYVRKFWKHGPFRWKFDESPWRSCGTDIKLLDSVELRPSIVANWVNLGEVELQRGQRRFRVELTEKNGPSAFDAFALVRGSYTPHGKLNPGIKYGPAPSGWFVFDPDSDEFAPTPVDLRYINEHRAGDGGFIRPDGRTLIHERTGEPVRFLGINAGHDVLSLTRVEMQHYARWLAKLGINLLRLHGPFCRDDALTQVRQDKLDQLHMLAFLLRDQGIYVGLSIYYPLWLKLDKSQGFDGYSGQSPFGLAYFDRKFQEIQKGWWRSILTTNNPYTGIPLAQDPTIAYLEIVNEDSTLFWTFAPYKSIPEPQTIQLEMQLGAWAKGKYGDLGTAFSRWRGPKVKGDDPGRGRVGLTSVWEIANNNGPRSKDAAEFLARLMLNYYSDLVRFVHNDLGYRGSTVCSNWRTADDAKLGPLDKWANSVCDIMDRHGYYSGPLHGAAAEYAVRAGQRYDDATVVRFDSPEKDQGKREEFSNPLIDLVFNDKPSFISELNWTFPNRFRAELPVMAAAYGRLQGTDGIFFFANSDPSWAHSLAKFSINDPVIMGQFPAAALIIRRGLIKEANAIQKVNLTIADAFGLRGVPVVTPGKFDLPQLKDLFLRFTGQDRGPTPIDPLSSFVGPVALSVTEHPQHVSLTNLANFIDRKNHILRSATGELLWDWGVGVATVKATCVQAAIGFLGRVGRIELPEMEAAMDNDYAALTLVALDDEPIRTSKRILLQVVTEAANAGWLAPGMGLRVIENAGHPPIVVRQISGVVQLKRRDAAQMKVLGLDINGYPLRRAKSGADHIVLLPDVLFYLIEP